MLYSLLLIPKDDTALECGPDEDGERGWMPGIFSHDALTMGAHNVKVNSLLNRALCKFAPLDTC